VPGAAVPALMVRVDPPPAVTEVGLSEAEAPAGAPLTLRLTDSAAPLTTAVLIVTLPLPPCPTDTVVGVALIEKSFPAVTPQDGNLNDAIRVFQLKVPLAGMYSVAYQKVQSSTGSMDIDE
jgi:hypothetical protein